MLRVLPKSTRSATYYVRDQALELEGVREGAAAYWLRGSGVIDDQVLESIWPQPPRSKTLGYDLVFAAPRPYSILLATAKIDEQRQAIALHRDAVRSAMNYLEEHALVIRASIEGESIELSARWNQALAFTHGVNRGGEPHLHDHVLVAAVPAHRRRALDSRALRMHAVAADAIYRAELRMGLTNTQRRVAWRTFAGHELVQGIDEGLRGLWPGERVYGAEKIHWTREGILEKWSRDMAHFEALYEHRVPLRSRDHVDEQVFSAHFEGQSTVSRSDLITATANAAVFGADRWSIEQFVDTNYPELANQRGSLEGRISIVDARQHSQIRSHGPRELGLTRTNQRDLPRSIERSR